jgi:hypothetical protein
MNFTLTRKDFRSDGIFGELVSDFGDFFYILEHAYLMPDGTYSPKTAAKTYTCELGEHALEDLVKFKAFELMDVPEFQGNPVSGILIHVGNYQRDSHGCLLIGLGMGRTYPIDGQMICSSKQAFKKFMDIQDGVTSFQLTIK